MLLKCYLWNICNVVYDTEMDFNIDWHNITISDDQLIIDTDLKNAYAFFIYYHLSPNVLVWPFWQVYPNGNDWSL